MKDDDQRILNIDLNQLQLRVNKDKQTTMLVRKQLNSKKKKGICLREMIDLF